MDPREFARELGRLINAVVDTGLQEVAAAAPDSNADRRYARALRGVWRLAFGREPTADERRLIEDQVG